MAKVAQELRRDPARTSRVNLLQLQNVQLFGELLDALDRDLSYARFLLNGNLPSDGTTTVSSRLDDITDGEYGNRLLHTTAFTHNISAAQLLIGCGASVNSRNHNDETPLHWASKTNAIDLCKLLIKSQADINLQDNSGSSALHHAVVSGLPEVVAMLLEEGCDVSLTDKDKHLAIELAQERRGEDHIAVHALMHRHYKRHGLVIPPQCLPAVPRSASTVAKVNNNTHNNNNNNRSYSALDRSQFNANTASSEGLQATIGALRGDAQQLVTQSISTTGQLVELFAGDEVWAHDKSKPTAQSLHEIGQQPAEPKPQVQQPMPSSSLASLIIAEADRDEPSQTRGSSRKTSSTAKKAQKPESVLQVLRASVAESKSPARRQSAAAASLVAGAGAKAPRMGPPPSSGRRASTSASGGNANSNSRGWERRASSPVLGSSQSPSRSRMAQSHTDILRQPSAEEDFASSAPEGEAQIAASIIVPADRTPWLPAHPQPLDVVVVVEQCCDCELHNYSVRHDAHKYARTGTRALKSVLEALMLASLPVRVYALKAKPEPQRVGALDISIAICVPAEPAVAENNSNSRGSLKIKPSAASGTARWVTATLHSKLRTKT